MLLVIGSGGLLGQAVAAWWRAAGQAVLTASSRPGADLVCDLNQDPSGWADRLPDGITAALLASAVTNIDACRRDEEQSWRFNVTRTAALLDQLLARGILPICCSTDLVFPGDRGGYTETDPPAPATAYGRQKRAVEEHLAATGADYLVLRLTKLYSLLPDDPSPVGGTLNALLAGNRVRAAIDQWLAPTWVGDVARAIEWLLAAGQRGCWHVTSGEAITRYDLARRLATEVDRTDLVEPCRLADLPLLEPRPLNTTLSGARLQAASGLTMMTLDEALPEIRRHRLAAGGERTWR